MSQVQIQLRPLLSSTLERAQFGLRVYDYARYWKHCTLKLARLRKKHSLTQSKPSEIPEKKKRSKGRSGKSVVRMEFTPVDFPPAVQMKDNGVLSILLFEAERAWAHSFTVLGTNPRQATRRLRKGLAFAQRLRNVSDDLQAEHRISAVSVAEVEAYVSRYAAEVQFRAGNHELAVVELSNCWIVAKYLSQYSTTPTTKVNILACLSETAAMIQLSLQGQGVRSVGNTSEIAQKSASFRDSFNWSQVQTDLSVEDNKLRSTHVTLKPIIWLGKEIQILHSEMIKPMLNVQKQTEKYEKSLNASKRFNISASVDSSTSMLPIDKYLMAVAEAEGMVTRLLHHEKSSPEQSDAGNNTSVTALNMLHQYLDTQSKQTVICRSLETLDTLFVAIDPESSRNCGPKISPEKFQTYLSQMSTLLETIVDGLNDLLSMDHEDSFWQQLSFAQHVFQVKKRIVKAIFCVTAPNSNNSEAVALLQAAKIDIRYAEKLNLSISSQDWQLPFRISDFNCICSIVSSLEQKSNKELFLKSLKASKDDTLPKIVYDVAASYINFPIAQIERLASGLPLENDQLADPTRKDQKIKAQLDLNDTTEEDLIQKEQSSTGWFSGLWGKK